MIFFLNIYLLVHPTDLWDMVSVGPTDYTAVMLTPPPPTLVSGGDLPGMCFTSPTAAGWVRTTLPSGHRTDRLIHYTIEDPPPTHQI